MTREQICSNIIQLIKIIVFTLKYLAKIILFDRILSIMRKNDLFFKILFAIELALLPLTIFSWFFMTSWSVGIFIACILLVKIWLELFKDKTLISHAVIMTINNIFVMSVLITLFMVTGAISLVLGIVTMLLILFMNVLKLVTFKYTMPEAIDAVDFCYTLFEIVTLVAFTFVIFYNMIANIGMIAIILTCVVSVIYRIVYIIKRTNLFKSKK